jgi:signal transduction histidine kinase
MLIFLTLAYLYFRAKIRKVREERDLLERKVVARTKTLIEQQRRLIETNQQLQKLTNELRTSMEKLKTAQLQLIQSEKMASLGTLIAGVTHELNNPITFIYSNFESLKDYISSITRILKSIRKDLVKNDPKLNELYEREDIEFIMEDLPQLLKGIEYGANRIKDIVAQLYRFSHPGKNRDKIDVHENIELTLNLFLNQYKRHVNIIKEYGEIPVVDAPSGDLNQVFLNLLVNAAYAIKMNQGEGNIWIKTWAENDHIFISIKDDGGGIPEEIQDKIFDPFFTTKPIGEGTGLGLSLCYTIIQNLNGDIEFRNVDGGAEFIVKIPVEQEENPE